MDIQTLNRIYTAYEKSELIQEIHPNDEMYNTGKPHYFAVGKSGLDAILLGLLASWKQDAKRILDLPCGHGRVSRHLRAAFPNAELFFSDLNREGADFCACKFSGRAIYSKPELTEMSLPQAIDIIWVGSLFTHLDRQRTSRWLDFLAQHLSDHGILVATFHGYFTAEHRLPGGGANRFEARNQMHAEGFGYSRYTTGIDDYGFSLSKPSCILDMANIPNTRILGYTERGWANNHDVLVLTRHDRLEPFKH
jgi:trans-aconitate methyltransferase